MFTFIDVTRLIAAVALCGIVLALPGVALARGFGLARAYAIVAGLAVLPLVDSLAARCLGLDIALCVTLVLAAIGALEIVRAMRRGELGAPSWQALALCAAWLAIVMVEWVDVDVAGRLYQPFTVIDAVKHAATSQAILDGGAPPRDPFFLRPERVSYYYFFYTPTALAQRLGLGLVDARAAVGGAVFWVGLALYGLVRLVLERAGLARAGTGTRLLVVALLAAGGLDIVAVLRMGLGQGLWLADPAAWNEEIAGWLESLLWVPHHVTALIAGMLGLAALAEILHREAGEGDHPKRGAGGSRTRGLARPAAIAVDTIEDRGGGSPLHHPSDGPPPPLRGGGCARDILLAALCFASSLGLSVWLTLALVVTVGLWAIALATEKRWRAIGIIALAGALALVLAAPQIHDLVAGRAAGGAAPIVPTVRAFPPIDAVVPAGTARYAARALALPLNYFAGFGILASGALLFWRTRRRDGTGTEFGRVLVCAAIAGLALGAFLKSTLFNNDLGWRVVLFPMLACLVWTVAALERLPASPLPQWRRAPAFLLLLLGLGWATTGYALVEMRAYPWLSNQPDFAFVGGDPETERALRVAYEWANLHLPAGAVLQHDPTRPRAFAFGLYGRHPTAVGDSYGSLFGASPARVAGRLDALAPLFSAALPAAAARARAEAAGVDALVVTAADPVWSRPDAAVMRARAAYASARVRIVPVTALTEAPAAPREAARATPAAAHL